MKIVISGTVGVGKSRISKLLYEALNQPDQNNRATLLEELQNDNPYLDFFYKNRPEWSFLIQIDFLLERFKNAFFQARELEKDKSHIIIFDRHFLDDYVFSKLTSIQEDISQMHLNAYYSFNNFLLQKLIIEDKPDYIFLLKADFDEVLQRIFKRGREYEQDYNLNFYWKDLYHNYYHNPEIQSYFKEHSKNFFIIDAKKNEEGILAEIMQILTENEINF